MPEPLREPTLLESVVESLRRSDALPIAFAWVIGLSGAVLGVGLAVVVVVKLGQWFGAW